jgi:gamma-glutamylcyclotransferase
MDSLLYLAYGSNLWPGRLAARVGTIAAVGTVRLADHALRFDKRGADGSGKCTLEMAAGALSYGAIYTLSDAARAVLDRIEGVGQGYHASWIEVDGFPPCYVYLADDRWRDASLMPFDWYKALVLAGARHHRFPVDYLSQIDAVPACPDLDPARAARNLGDLDIDPAIGMG